VFSVQSYAQSIETIATIATDKFTLKAYKQKNPKKAHIAMTYRAGIFEPNPKIVNVVSV